MPLTGVETRFVEYESGTFSDAVTKFVSNGKNWFGGIGGVWPNPWPHKRRNRTAIWQKRKGLRIGRFRPPGIAVAWRETVVCCVDIFIVVCREFFPRSGV